MIKKFTVYNSVGVIMRTGNCPAEALSMQARDGETVVEGHWPDDEYYFDGDQPKPKKEITPTFSKKTLAADGTDSITISGIPAPCRVALEETVYDVPDGVFEFTVDQLGVHAIQIRATHYHDFNATVEVV